MNSTLRDALTGALNMEKLKTELEKLDGYDYVRGSAMILKYVLPALSNIEIELTELTVPDFLKMDKQSQTNYLKSLEN